MTEYYDDGAYFMWVTRNCQNNFYIDKTQKFVCIVVVDTGIQNMYIYPIILTTYCESSLRIRIGKFCKPRFS